MTDPLYTSQCQTTLHSTTWENILRNVVCKTKRHFTPHIADCAVDSLDTMKEFLDGEKMYPLPWLYYNDKWLEKLSRSDVVWDRDRDEIETM
jgi:hypothetical protein